MFNALLSTEEARELNPPFSTRSLVDLFPGEKLQAQGVRRGGKHRALTAAAELFPFGFMEVLP